MLEKLPEQCKYKNVLKLGFMWLNLWMKPQSGAAKIFVLPVWASISTFVFVFA